LPYLLATLDLDRCPPSTGYLLARYPQHAERVVAAIMPVFRVRRAGDGHPPEWDGLRCALRAFGPAAAPAVPKLLAAGLDKWSAKTLGQIGPSAAEAVPALRAAATGDNAELAVAAAGALWQIEGSLAVLPMLTARIDGPAGVAALEEIAAMGPAARTAAPYVATFLEVPDKYWWLPTQAAIALWQVTGDAVRAAPVLAAAWHGNQDTRTAIAEAANGPLAVGLEPLLRAELAAPGRHGVSETGWSSAQVGNHERLLAACRAALVDLER
jgi:hypothetical protein